MGARATSAVAPQFGQFVTGAIIYSEADMHTKRWLPVQSSQSHDFLFSSFGGQACFKIAAVDGGCSWAGRLERTRGSDFASLDARAKRIAYLHKRHLISGKTWSNYVL